MKADFYGMIGNLRKQSKIEKKDMLFKKLADQINDPDPLRSKILTLHLLIEYWYDKIIDEKPVLKSKNLTSFFSKNEELHNANLIDDMIHKNCDIIRRIRNLYAHELDIAKVSPEIEKLLNEIEFSKYFEATSRIDRFLAISIQSMFQVEEKYYQIKYPDKYFELSDEDVRQILINKGKLFWQYCELIEVNNKPHYVKEYILKCPYCFKGKIIRYKDNTPGDKESYFMPCDKCKLDGDGSYLIFDSIKE